MPWIINRQKSSIKVNGKLLKYGDTVPDNIVTENMKKKLKWNAPAQTKKQQPREAKE